MSSNLNMQSNFIEVLSKKGRAKKTKQAASDELDLALDTIEEENNVTLRKIKDQMASQVSDTDGRDARFLSTPELLEKCRMVITKDNPTGQSPGLVQTGPTMLNLLTRYQTYANIVKGTAVQTSVGQQMSKPRSSFASFPPGRDAAKAHKAVVAAAKAKTASPKVSKQVVTTTSGIKPLIMRSVKQFAVSTIQGQAETGTSGGRSRYCPVDRFGSYTRGQRKFATSALDDKRKMPLHSGQELIDLLNDSDGHDVPVIDPPAKKQRIIDDDSMWVGLPLLKDEDCDGFDDAISDDIESDIGSDISGASIVTSEGLLTFPDADLLELEQGYNAQLFYACVGALPEGVYEDSPPPDHSTGLFQSSFICPQDFVLQSLTDHDTTLTIQDLRLWESATLRHQYLFLCQRTFWNKTIDECKDCLLGLTKNEHLDVVMVGEGFTNSVWDHASTLQYDVQKLWYYVQTHGTQQYDTVVPDFGHVPLKHVTLSFLLLLPITAVFGYLAYHGVDVTRTPWQLTSTLDDVGRLPVSTRVPFAIWHNYLVVLLDHLHGLMSNEEDAYALMHAQYALGSEQTLTKEDAVDFVKTHFPDEGRLLQQPADHLALLQRATHFARNRKYTAEIYTRCTAKWVVFLYYIINNAYPPKSNRSLYQSDC
jgi:hypothetical protein